MFSLSLEPDAFELVLFLRRTLRRFMKRFARPAGVVVAGAESSTLSLSSWSCGMVGEEQRRASISCRFRPSVVIRYLLGEASL